MRDAEAGEEHASAADEVAARPPSRRRLPKISE
jgi:hypothetical protein